MNQQGNCGQNHFGQPMQQDQPFGYNQQQQQQQQNSCAQNSQSVLGNSNCFCTPGIGQPQVMPCGNFLPHNILEQIRTCVGNTAPIFILPNSQPIQTQFPQLQQNPPQQVNVGYPNVPYPSSMTNGYPGITSNPIFSSPCYPFPIPIPICNAFGNQNQLQSEKNSMRCDCCGRNNNASGNSGQIKNPGMSEEVEVHRCCPGNDDTICTKPNCPASISLQALASQLLSLRGVIPCAATRLVLRKVPGSNVTTTVEDTMVRAQKSISLLNKDQLITEARNAQHVNGLINLHMTSNSLQNIIPALTMLQLKVNSLKTFVENLINKNISECQSIGAEGNTNLEPMILGIKSDAELRELLATLRQKECEERVNVNYAPYHSQRVVAESRLSNFQNKINQVETEMEKRRAAAMPWLHSNAQFHQEPFFKGGNYRPVTFHDTNCNDPRGFNPIFNQLQTNDAGGNGFESPSPFMVQIQNPKRLNLKPNVGGPETTYDQSEEKRVLASQVEQSEKNGEVCCRDGKSWDQENAEPSKEVASSNGGKKKLKIHIDDKGELSVKKKSLEELKVGELVELSPDVVIVIDKELQESKDEDKSKKKSKKKKQQKKNVRKKSAESIPSDSTCGSRSETSVSSKSSDPEEKPEEPRLENKRSKSILKNVSKGKKKTPMNEKDVREITSHDISDKTKSMKEEKHVSVATMISEIYKNKFHQKNEIDGHESELLTLSKNHRGRENFPLSSSVEKNENRNEERLNVIRENADDLETSYDSSMGQVTSKEICSIMTDASSIISFKVKDLKAKNLSANNQNLKILSEKDSNVEVNYRLRRSTKSKRPKEARNRTVDRFDGSPIVESDEEKSRRGGEINNKENTTYDKRTCSITGKKNRDIESPEGSISNSIDLDDRKRWNHRFK